MKRPAILLLLLALLPAPQALSCGLQWEEHDHYPNGFYNEQDAFSRRFSLWTTLGTLKLDGKRALPLLLRFEPAGRAAAGDWGRYWGVPLLDSSVNRVDDEVFQIEFPDGNTTRATKRKNLLVGSSWAITCDGDTIECVSECGWKLRYVKNRLVRITTPEAVRVEIVRRDDGSQEVLCAGRTLLKVTRTAEGRVFRFDEGRTVTFGLVDDPFGGPGAVSYTHLTLPTTSRV